MGIGGEMSALETAQHAERQPPQSGVDTDARPDPLASYAAQHGQSNELLGASSELMSLPPSMDELSRRSQADALASTPLDPHQPHPEEQPVDRVGLVAHDGEQRLKLRATPDTTQDNITAELAFNTHLHVLGAVPGGWYRVTLPSGEAGFVAALYIRTNLPEPRGASRADSAIRPPLHARRAAYVRGPLP